MMVKEVWKGKGAEGVRDSLVNINDTVKRFVFSSDSEYDLSTQSPLSHNCV